MTSDKRPDGPIPPESLSESTARGARPIFVRFLLVGIGASVLVGAAVVAYNVASSLQQTDDHLGHLGELHGEAVARLRETVGGTDRETVRRASRLLGVPMAILARADGSVIYATDAAIPRMMPRIFPGRPAPGTRVRISGEMGHLSGGWTVSRLSDQHDLLVISVRMPEDEGLALYMTIAAGVTGVGIALAFLVMLAAANWMLRRPLDRLVADLTGALARDVQRRREAEEHAVAARQEAEEHLAFMNSLIDASRAVGIIATDADGRIRIFNRTATEILGYEAEEVVGRLTLDRLRERHGGVRGAAEAPLSMAQPREGEEIWTDRQGNEHLLGCNCSAIVDSSGVARGELVTFIDLTERRKLEAELQLNELQLIQSAKLATLGEMATGIAHELNQPLNNIGLLASRISRRVSAGAADGESREFLEDRLVKIQSQVERAGKIIDHLRIFGRAEGRQLEPISVREPVEGVIVLLREQLNRLGIELVVDLSDDLPLVEADGARLEQVLMNLILNARDALEQADGTDAKEIRISAARAALDGQPAITIRVTDTGPGISSALRERIFEPFFTTKEVGKGTGLGLSISYGLVRGFGGRLGVESEPGEGASFAITLRVAGEPVAP